MRSVSQVAVAGALWVAPASGAADGPPSTRLDVGVSLGYAAPGAEAERGASLRDTTFAQAVVGVDAAYLLASHLGLAVQLGYGLGIPTLCRAAGDCEASLGSDTLVALAARVYLPRLGPIDPIADAGFGYEWFTSRLSDQGAHASRSYDGPVLFRGLLAAPFRLGTRWTLGPILAFTVGTFTGYGLDTNLESTSGPVPARTVHIWTTFGLRIGLRR